MAKNKQRDKKRREREKRRGKRHRSPRGEDHARARARVTRAEIDPPDLERCAPPIHVDTGLHRVPDPYELLGLDPLASPTTDDVRRAWQRAIERHAPERAPEKARALTAARDRLLAPERFLERRLGVLHPPDPAAHGLPVEPLAVQRSERLPARTRLLGQLVLYALLEDELSGHRRASRPRQTDLPF